MYRILVIGIVMLLIGAPAAAQTTVWSAALTTGEIVFADGDVGVGYWDFPPDAVEGTLTDNEFDYQGTTHKVVLLYQHNGGGSDGNVFLRLVPSLSEEDIRSFTFTADGGALDLQTIHDLGDGGSSYRYVDPGFRWTAGQRVDVALTAPATTPALPLIGVGLLALMLGVGAYRRVSHLTR